MKTFAIVDDHQMMRMGILSFLEEYSEFHCIINTDSGETLLERIETIGIIPDICILDIKMQGWDGFKTLQELKKRYGKSTEVLMFSLYVTHLNIHRAIKLGARGVIDKDCPPDVFIEALIAMANGKLYIRTPDIFETEDISNINLIQLLTPNELVFLGHCLTDLSYREIAEKMGITVRTVESYRDKLFEKLKVKTRSSLAVYAVYSGFSFN